MAPFLGLHAINPTTPDLQNDDDGWVARRSKNAKSDKHNKFEKRNNERTTTTTGMNGAQPHPAQALHPRQPSNDEAIIRRPRELIMYLYGEQGYTVGKDGDFVIKKKPFDTIMKFPKKPVFMDEVQRRHDLCGVRGIDPGCRRPPRNLGSSTLGQLKLQLRTMTPSLVHRPQDLNRRKRQMDAIRQVVQSHDQNTALAVAYTAVHMAMENPDQFLGSEMSPPQQPTLDEPMVVENVAAADKADKDGFTVLDIAVLNGDLDIAQELCKEMDISTRGLGVGSSSLHWAANFGRVDVVRELINQAGDIEMKDKYGITPLHLASYNGHLDVVQLLVESKADIHTKEKGGKTPLYWASENGHLNVVTFLVENKADIHAKSKHDGTPLHSVSRKGHLDVVKFLVENKADVNAKDKEYGDTPLHYASSNGRLDVVKFLVENKADIHAKTRYGETPLHYASSNGRLHVVQFLVESKAEINAKSNGGETPLHRASCTGQLNVVTFLVENKADINAKKNNGWTPLHQASFYGHLDVVEYLRSKGGTE